MLLFLHHAEKNIANLPSIDFQTLLENGKIENFH